MDLENYKEAFKRGENIDFYVSRERMCLAIFIFLVFAVYGVHVLLSSFSSGIEDWREIIVIIAGICCLYATLRVGKGLLFKQHSLLLSLNKESLLIYDKFMF